MKKNEFCEYIKIFNDTLNASHMVKYLFMWWARYFLDNCGPQKENLNFAVVKLNSA